MALLDWINKHFVPAQHDPSLATCKLTGAPVEAPAPPLRTKKLDAGDFHPPRGDAKSRVETNTGIAAGRRILYVAENPADAEAARQTFNPSIDGWTFFLAEGRLEAQTMQENTPFDAVICDYRSPSDSNEFLSRVAMSHPHAHRFVVCDPTNRDFLRHWNGAPPRPILRGADFSSVQETLESAFGLEAWLSNGPVKKLIVHMRKLPALPTLYTRVTAELEAEEPSIDLIAEIISKEPVMTAKVIQFVNSGYFGLSGRVTTPRDAVLFLGMQRTRAIVLLASVFSKFEDARCPGFSLSDFAAHSITVANYASAIAKAENGDKKLADTAFTAGLLHDIGRLLMAANLPDSYNQVIYLATDKNHSLHETERDVYGTNHAELGACLLATWGQAAAIVDAVGLHHEPLRSGDHTFSLLTALHVANALDQKIGIGAPPVAVDSAYLRSIGAEVRFEVWRELCHG